MSCKIYRDIYVKGYKRFPTQKLTGRIDLYYTGKLVCGINSLPERFDKDKDKFISCECDFPKWRKLIKIKLKNNS